MATDTTTRTPTQPQIHTRAEAETARVRYRFTAAQVMRMIEAGIIADDEDVELWDGVLYKMTKGEIHNVIVATIAALLRSRVPAEAYHVREEKSNTYGKFSLPEPDVEVVRGGLFDYLPAPPPLSCVALVVEVDHHTSRSDAVLKFARYAEVKIAVYWHVVVEAREIRVHEEPHGRGRRARYGKLSTYRAGDAVPIVIDGQEVGRVAVADLFPPAPTPPAPPALDPKQP